MPPSMGVSIPGTVVPVVAIAFSATGSRFAAAHWVKALYPTPYIPTRPSLQLCCVIQAMTARASSPSCWYGMTASVLLYFPRV